MPRGRGRAGRRDRGRREGRRKREADDSLAQPTGQVVGAASAAGTAAARAASFCVLSWCAVAHRRCKASPWRTRSTSPARPGAARSRAEVSRRQAAATVHSRCDPMGRLELTRSWPCRSRTLHTLPARGPSRLVFLRRLEGRAGSQSPDDSRENRSPASRLVARCRRTRRRCPAGPTERAAALAGPRGRCRARSRVVLCVRARSRANVRSREGSGRALAVSRRRVPRPDVCGARRDGRVAVTRHGHSATLRSELEARPSRSREGRGSARSQPRR